MRSTKIIKICSSSLCTCLHHMVILRTRNKITDFFMILAWASPFKQTNTSNFIPLKAVAGGMEWGGGVGAKLHPVKNVKKITIKGLILWNSIALTSNIFTYRAGYYNEVWGRVCYVTLFTPSCHLKRFPMTLLRFTELPKFMENFLWNYNFFQICHTLYESDKET